MKRTALFALLAFATSSVLAFSCPKHMKEIDAALGNAKLNASQMAEVKKLRAEGESLHKAGKHTESEAALGKAKGILGIR